MDMQEMFKDASAFNQDIGRWDVSNVQDTQEMFEGASALEKRIPWRKGGPRGRCSLM